MSQVRCLSGSAFKLPPGIDRPTMNEFTDETVYKYMQACSNFFCTFFILTVLLRLSGGRRGGGGAGGGAGGDGGGGGGGGEKTS